MLVQLADQTCGALGVFLILYTEHEKYTRLRVKIW